MNKEIELVIQMSTGNNQVPENEFVEAPDSYFTRVAVQDVLEVSKNPAILDVIVSKIRKGGTLMLEGIDALDICRRVHYGNLSLSDASSQFFAATNSLNSVATLKSYFAAKKWHIKFAGLQNGRYLVEVVRNG